MEFARPLARLVSELARLPGVGPRSAQRLAFHILNISREEAASLASAITEAKERIRRCSECFNFSDGEQCEICSNDRRDARTLCVVADPRDVMAMERTGEFRGRYHVLGGLISPLDRVGPDRLRVRELIHRIGATEVTELVLATNPTVEGDATALYIAGLVKPLGVRVSKIAFGLPVGGELDYADQATLIHALEGRREM